MDKDGTSAGLEVAGRFQRIQQDSFQDSEMQLTCLRTYTEEDWVCGTL